MENYSVSSSLTQTLSCYHIKYHYYVIDLSVFGLPQDIRTLPINVIGIEQSFWRHSPKCTQIIENALLIFEYIAPHHTCDTIDVVETYSNAILLRSRSCEHSIERTNIVCVCFLPTHQINMTQPHNEMTRTRNNFVIFEREQKKQQQLVYVINMKQHRTVSDTSL